MLVPSPRSGDPHPGTPAEVLVGWLLDRIGRLLDGPAEQSAMDELAAAWRRVRAKPGRLSAKTRDEWSRIETFMGVSGFGWFLLTVVIGVLFLIIPATGWAGPLVHGTALLAASLTTGLAVTRLAVHYGATAAISRGYASSRRIRTVALLLRTRAVLGVALVAAAVLYPAFGR